MIATALAAVLGFPEFAHAASDPNLEARLAAGLKRGYPGVAVMLEEPSGGTRGAAAGYSDLARGTAMRVDDAFQLASITKLFTTTAALQLVDQGKLALDATIASLLGAAVAKIPHASEITVAELMDHSSGIYPTNNDPDYLATVIGAKSDPRLVWAPEQFVRLADGARQPAVAKPGEGHHYSDTNLILLSMIVERVAGVPFKRYVTKTLFEPLGLRSTAFYSDRLVAGEASLEPAPPTVRGYMVATPDIQQAIAIHPMFRPVSGFGTPDTPLLDTTLAAERVPGAADIISTLPDLIRFGSALFRGRLLSARSQAVLMAAGDGLAELPVGTARIWTAQALRQPWGVAVYKEGDGPGGVNTLLAFHPASGELFAGFVNEFGRFDEVDFLFEVFGQSIPAPLKGTAKP